MYFLFFICSKYYNAARGGGQGDYREGIKAKIANVVDCLQRFPHSQRAILTVPFANQTSDKVCTCIGTGCLQPSPLTPPPRCDPPISHDFCRLIIHQTRRPSACGSSISIWKDGKKAALIALVVQDCCGCESFELNVSVSEHKLSCLTVVSMNSQANAATIFPKNIHFIGTGLCCVYVCVQVIVYLQVLTVFLNLISPLIRWCSDE